MKPHLLVLSAVLVACSWSSTALAAETLLPAPIDLAAAPVPDSPGGSRLPALAEDVAADAPVIAAGMETAFADETLCLTGSNLDGVALRLWSEDGLTALPPLRSAPDRLQVVLPRDLPASTLLLWPQKDGKIGAPFRVNGASVWWAWPHRVQVGSDRTVRLFGRNLALPGKEPQCVLEAGGKKQRLEVARQDAYHLEAALPEGLAEGSITLWAHNGTGGALGWSDPVSLGVVPSTRAPERKFRVDDFGPPPPGREDCSPAISRAINACREAGGGVVIFAKRAYVIKKPVHLPKGVPIVLRGAGMGRYDAFTDDLGNDGTVITDWLAGAKPGAFAGAGVEMVTLNSPGQKLEDMTVRLVADVSPLKLEGAVIRLRAAHTALTRVRVVSIRESASCVECEFEGEAGQSLDGCELVTAGKGINIAERNHFVRITGCRVLGGYRVGRGVIADAVRNRGARGLIVEDCEFSSIDREHGRLLSRACMLGHGNVHGYFAHNRVHDTGAHPSVPAIDTNISEQILFHRGIDNAITCVVSAGAQTLRVSLPGAAPGSGEPPDCDEDGKLDPALPGPAAPLDAKWAVFITKGRALGQWRVITRVLPDGSYRLDRPWRLVPAAGDWACVQRFHRQNIAHANHIVCAAAPEKVLTTHKTTGVFLHSQCLENIVAANRIENAGQGLAVGMDYAQPSAWNLFRDNRMQHIIGHAGGTAPVPCFCIERLMRPPPTLPYPDHAYGLGNVFRSNSGLGAGAAGVVGYSFPDDRRYPSAYRPALHSGLLMSVVENNQWRAVERGFVLSEPVNWLVFRNNLVETNDPAKPAIARIRETGMVAPLIE